MIVPADGPRTSNTCSASTLSPDKTAKVQVPGTISQSKVKLNPDSIGSSPRNPASDSTVPLRPSGRTITGWVRRAVMGRIPSGKGCRGWNQAPNRRHGPASIRAVRWSSRAPTLLTRPVTPLDPAGIPGSSSSRWTAYSPYSRTTTSGRSAAAAGAMAATQAATAAPTDQQRPSAVVALVPAAAGRSTNPPAARHPTLANRLGATAQKRQGVHRVEVTQHTVIAHLLQCDHRRMALQQRPRASVPGQALDLREVSPVP